MPAEVGFPANFLVLERGWLSSNSLVVLGQGDRHDEAAIIDTGYVNHAPQTKSLVEHAIGNRRLTAIVNTHLHSDHCGGNAELMRRWPEAKLAIPPGLAAAVETWDEVALTYSPTGQRCERFSFDTLLRPDTSVQLAGETFEVHAAPGHDPHSVVLFHRRSRTLLSADALWEHGFGVIFPALEGIQAFDEVDQTFDLIESLLPLNVIPGHGAPFSDTRGALARARSKLAYFRDSPEKHALHGVKVLMKYHALDVQSETRASFMAWLHNTSYFRTVHAAYGRDTPLDAWLDQALAGLTRAGALEITDEFVCNLD